MCTLNQSNSISIFQLSLPLIFFITSALNIVFLVRHWTQFKNNDDQILRTIAIFLFLISHSLAVFIAYVYSQNLIYNVKLRILFVILSGLSLVRVYTFLYQKFDSFGVRLKSIEYKFAIVDFSIQVCHFLFKYSMQYIIYIPILVRINNDITSLDLITVHLSIFVLIVSVILLVTKAACLMNCEEQEDHWVKRIIFMGVFPCQMIDCGTSRNYFENSQQEQSWTTDYS